MRAINAQASRFVHQSKKLKKKKKTKNHDRRQDSGDDVTSSMMAQMNDASRIVRLSRDIEQASEVLDCFFCLLLFEFLGTCEFRIPHKSPDWIGETCVTIRELGCPPVSRRQRHSLHCDTTSARFEFFRSLLSGQNPLPPISHLPNKPRVHQCSPNTYRHQPTTQNSLEETIQLTGIRHDDPRTWTEQRGFSDF